MLLKDLITKNKVTESLFKETIDLLNERQDVVSEIAKAGENKSLVETQNQRLKEIDGRLSSISAENKLKITGNLKF